MYGAENENSRTTERESEKSADRLCVTNWQLTIYVMMKPSAEKRVHSNNFFSFSFFSIHVTIKPNWSRSESVCSLLLLPQGASSDSKKKTFIATQWRRSMKASKFWLMNRFLTQIYFDKERERDAPFALADDLIGYRVWSGRLVLKRSRLVES